MININKKYILFLAITTTSWFAQSTTLTIPQSTVENQEVSLFVLVEDQEVLKAGFFELNGTESVNKICADEFHSVKEATLDLDGTEVAIFNSHDTCLEDDSVIYFEIDSDVEVIRALVISNSLLDEVVFQFADFEVLTDDTAEEFDFNFDNDLFGIDLKEQQEAVLTNQVAPSKYFSASQVIAIIKIAGFVGMDAAKTACSNINKRAKRCARWLTGYKS